MKKLTVSLMCIILASSAAMAQKTFTFGPKVGVDLTHFWGSGTKFYDSNNVQLNYQVTWHSNGNIQRYIYHKLH